MESDKIDVEKISNHWIYRSDEDYRTMNNLMKSKDYHWALFIGHLVIERLLKAYLVRKTKSNAPLTHDLRRLVKLAELDVSKEQEMWLDTISTFNLNARYDNYKQDFYKKCTKNFADIWTANIKKIRKWIKTKL